MNNTEKIIMELNLTKLQLLNSLHLSGVEYKVFWFVKAVIFSESQEVAMAFNITIPYASALLRKLADKGYLARKETPDKSGGYYFEYSIAKSFRKVVPTHPIKGGN